MPLLSSSFSQPGDSARSAGRPWLAAACALYLAFVVYGSLVPLQFRAVPWAEALRRFQALAYLQLGIEARADWAANILLFVPLAFLAAGAVARSPRWLWRAAQAMAVWLSCCGLAVALEFTQIFFPARTLSVNDIVAESLGAMIGVALWWFAGAQVERACARLGTSTQRNTLLRMVLVAYGIGFALYQLMPLDLTLSPAELYRKWADGRVVLVPFGYQGSSRSEALYQFLADSLLWTPVSLLLLLGTNLGYLAVLGMTVFLAAILEAAQFLVYSRVSDVTDLISAGAGALLTIAIWSRWEPRAVRPRSGLIRGPELRWALAFALWAGTVVAIFWYPFDFSFDRRWAAERLRAIPLLPFVNYYRATEFKALSQLLRKMLLFAPLGVFLAGALRGVHRAGFSRIAVCLAAGGIAAVALGVEGGQVLLPDKVPDPTDCLLTTAGGLIGYLAAIRLRRAS